MRDAMRGSYHNQDLDDCASAVPAREGGFNLELAVRQPSKQIEAVDAEIEEEVLKRCFLGCVRRGQTRTSERNVRCPVFTEAVGPPTPAVRCERTEAEVETDLAEAPGSSPYIGDLNRLGQPEAQWLFHINWRAKREGFRCELGSYARREDIYEHIHIT